jgi:hypothetical protein
MQRTIIVSGGGSTQTYIGTGSAATYYGPLGGAGAVGNPTSTVTGTGAYWHNEFACVLSKLYIEIGDVYNGTPMSCTCQINVGGTTPAPGNLSAGNPAVGNATPAYYYDATDIDALTAGQLCGFMESLSAAASPSSVLAPSRGVACDSPNAGFAPTNGFATGGTSFNSSPRYASVAGSGLSSTVAPSQQFASMAFVASGLQWQTASGNATTSTDATCTFSHGPTLGSPTDTSLKAIIASAGFVGLMYDATDTAAVPAGDYYNMHVTGTNLSGNTLKVVTQGIHMQGAANNSCAMLSGGAFTSTQNAATTWGCFNQSARFDSVHTESIVPYPTSGVLSNLSVNIGTYTDPATFTLLTTQGTGDTGAGTGNIPTSGGNSATAGFSTTSVAVAVSAAGWSYDATDICAVVGGQNHTLLQCVGTNSGLTLQGQQINFTAPAHLGLTTMGAG